MLQGKKLSEWLSDKRVIRFAVILGSTAILLIGLTSFFEGRSSGRDCVDDYSDRLQEELIGIVSQIDGVGEVRLFLTMDKGGENVYMKNTDTKTVSIEPKVRGVVVVCDGGDDPIVASRVLEAVTKTLDIGSDKVCITKIAAG